MASYRAETSFAPEIVPFLLTRADYVGFFLKIKPHEPHFTAFLLNKNEVHSHAELMRNLAVIYDSFAKA